MNKSQEAVVQGKHGGALKFALVIKQLTRFVIDVIITILIVQLFEIKWEYAYFKVFVAVVVFSVLKDYTNIIAQVITYRFALRELLKDDIKYHVQRYKDHVRLDDVHNYDDYLGAAVLSTTLPFEDKVKAAVSLGMVKQNMLTVRLYEDRVWTLFEQVIEEVHHSDDSEDKYD